MTEMGGRRGDKMINTKGRNDMNSISDKANLNTVILVKQQICGLYIPMNYFCMMY